MTNKEKEFKKAFKHKHVTNAEMVGSTLRSELKVFYRYNTNKGFKEMRTHIMSTAEKFENLKYICSQSVSGPFDSPRRKYEYSVAIFSIK